MNIIERAINKLDGNEEPVEDEIDALQREPSNPSTSAENLKNAEISSTTATAEAGERKTTNVELSDAEVAALKVARAPSPELVTETPAAERTLGDKGVLHIDFDRMAAAGFLNLDGTNTHQSEEYQQIKRRLLGNTIDGVHPTDKPANLIMITSSVPGEGKTFTSVNMAISLAMEIDHTILAVDTDIVKRDLTRVFGALDRKGLYDVLIDPTLDIGQVMLRTSIPNLSIVPAGHNQGGSTELLASTRMKTITRELATRYKDRIVVFDTPPILATSTALALAPQVGQLCVVVEAGKTKQETVNEALKLIDRLPVTGLIFNKSKQNSKRAYEYYGYYVKSDNES